MTDEQKKEFDERRLRAVRIAFETLGISSLPPRDGTWTPQWLEVVKETISRRVAELELLSEELTRTIAKLDKAEAEYDSKWHCPVDDCDQPHCRKCGRHSDGVGDSCAACEVERAQAEMAAVSAAFGGDHEAAARHMGW